MNPFTKFFKHKLLKKPLPPFVVGSIAGKVYVGGGDTPYGSVIEAFHAEQMRTHEGPWDWSDSYQVIKRYQEEHSKPSCRYCGREMICWNEDSTWGSEVLYPVNYNWFGCPLNKEHGEGWERHSARRVKAHLL